MNTMPQLTRNAMKAPTPEYVNALAAFVADLKFADLSRATVDHAVTTIRDTLGCMLAGARQPDIAGLHGLAPQGETQATLVGARLRTSVEFAALANGIAGISLELDEGNQFALNHPAVHILPAALATAEAFDRSGPDLIAAFVAGYDVASRVGRATHLRDAVHPFGTHAIVGAAAAVGKLRGFDRARLATAMLMAGGMALASSQTAANAGASVRNVVTGLTNANAVLACRLTEVGFNAEPEAFEVVFGKILGDRFDPSQIGAGLADDYFIPRNYFKVHACSRWNHAPIEAAIAALQGRKLALAEIAAVTVHTFDPAIRLHWPSPVNGYAAKHSIPYNVAVRILRDDNGLNAYTDAVVADPDVRALARKVAVREDPAMTARLPAIRAARVEITLVNGECLAATVEQPPGGFDNPFPAEVLTEKFRRLAGIALPPDRIAQLEETIAALPTLKTITLLGQALAG